MVSGPRRGEAGEEDPAAGGGGVSEPEGDPAAEGCIIAVEGKIQEMQSSLPSALERTRLLALALPLAGAVSISLAVE